MDISWLETAEAEELLWGLMIRGMGITYLIVAWGLYNQVCTRGGRRSMAGRTVLTVAQIVPHAGETGITPIKDVLRRIRKVRPQSRLRVRAGMQASQVHRTYLRATPCGTFHLSFG